MAVATSAACNADAMSVVGTRDFHVIDAGDLRVLHGGLLDFCQGDPS